MSRVVSALEKNKAGVFGTGVTMENTVAIREEPAEKTTVEPEREGVRVGPHAQLAGELSKWKGGKRGCHRGSAPGVLEKGKSDSVAGVREKSENETTEVRSRGDATRQP